MKHSLASTLVPLVLAIGGCSSNSASTQSAEVAGSKGDPDAASDDAANVATDDASGDSGSGAVEYDANLSGAQVVPAVQTSSTGTGKFFLQSDGVTLNYQITLSVPNATAVNLHTGAPGVVGAVAHQLMPVASTMSGSVTLSADEASALVIDQLYLDVATAANQAGAVRGQLVLPGSEIFVATATGAQQVPPVMSAYQAHASFILSPDQATAFYHVDTNAVPSDVLLDRSIAGITGQVAYPLMPVGQTIDAVLQLAANDATDFEAAHFYVSIVTAANPAGELRGQLIKPGETLFEGELAGANEAPPVASMASGAAQFVLSPAQTSVRYEVIVNGIIPTAAEVDNAPAAMSGPTLFPLTLNSSGALGTQTLNGGETADFLAGHAYVNVETVSYAQGEVRAQLVAH